MATITAQANGNWSAGGTWVGGVAPGSGDVAALATFAVTADQDITVQAVTHTSATGVLIVSSGTRTITITAPQVNTVNSSYLFRCTGGTANFVGTFQGGTSTGRAAIDAQSGSTVTVTTATGGSGAAGAYGVNAQSGSTVTVTNATGGTAGTSYGVDAASGSTVTVTNATGGSSAVYAVNAQSGSTVTVTNASASTSAAAVKSASTTSRITGTMTSASNGYVPVEGIWLFDNAATVSLLAFNLDNWPSAVGNQIVLSVQGSSNPGIGNVRAGVTYGAGGALTGTLAVPSPASVAAGVATDNTVGTAAVKLDDIATVTGAQIAAATSA